MDVEQLCSRLGQLGDERTIRRVYPDNQTQPMFNHRTNPPLWSLAYRLTNRFDEGQGTVLDWLLVLTIAPFLLLLVIDLVHAVLRLSLYPVALALWRLERTLAVLQGRTFFCEHCQHDMKDPVVMCPTPDCPCPLQPPLRPTYNALFTRVCPGCQQKRWRLVGQRFCQRSGPLLCLDSNGTSGCGRQLLLTALMGRPRYHIAVAGTSVRAKHAGLAGFLQALTGGSVRGMRYRAVSKLGRLELEVARRVLYRGFALDTSRFECPGENYTMARSLVLVPRNSGPAVVLHNLPTSWIERPHHLAQRL